jgi:hypothetical protein
MYIFTLVGDVRKVLDRLRAERGDFTLAMLYNSTLEADSSWNLIVSGPWTDKLGTAEATRVIAQALHEGLGLENRPAISRVTVLKLSDPFVKDMTTLYPVVGAGEGVPVSQVLTGEVREGSGFVFYSQRAAA